MLNYLTILLKRSWSKLKVLLPQVDHVPCSVQGCILPVTFLNPHQSKCQLFVVSYEPPLSFLLWGKTPLFFSMNFWFPQSIHPIRLHLGSAYMPVKSLQSCPTLCDPIVGSPPGSPVPGILQARTLEWVAIPFPNAWKWKVKMKSLSRVWLFTTPWTAAYQAPRPGDFPGQSTGVGCHCLLCVCFLSASKSPNTSQIGNFSKLTSSLNVITHSHPLLSLLIIMIIPAHITYLCSGQASLPFVDEKSKSQRS